MNFEEQHDKNILSASLPNMWPNRSDRKKFEILFCCMPALRRRFPANDQCRVAHSNTILPVSQAEKIDALLWKSDQALRLGKVSHC